MERESVIERPSSTSKAWGFLAGFASVFVFASIGQAEPSGPACDAALAEQTARRVQSRYEGIRDLRADFEQTNVSATFQGEALTSPVPRHGKVVFAKPGRMRWTYAAPEASVVASDGKTLWIHDLDAKTVTRLAVTEGYLSGAALQFLMGDGDVMASFKVAATSCDAKQVTLDLTPREDASYERLGLVADRATGIVVATSVTDLFGNVTRIRFSRLEENRNPAPDTFVLKIPQGVEVIDYAESRTR
ncbi:outer membrane lipoprotein carrier protein LolA [Myxococcota bacterium]|nr:outer membrane lipoprotein carrier protein LolA [Myxococcota bacterium]